VQFITPNNNKKESVRTLFCLMAGFIAVDNV